MRFPHQGLNPQCLALKPSALTITPRERLMVIRPIFLLFIFIDLFFKTTYAPVCQFVWNPLSGIRLGMEPSTKYQKHSPGIISSATLFSRIHIIVFGAKVQNRRTIIFDMKNENETYFSYFQTQCYISGKIRKCMKRSNWHFRKLMSSFWHHKLTIEYRLHNSYSG